MKLRRRDLLKSTAVLAAARTAPLLADDNVHPGLVSPILAYIGSYTPNGQGIYLFSFNPATGALILVKVVSMVRNPSWIAIHPQGRFLYAVNEISNFNGTTSGSVSAFAINRNTGDLTFLNAVSSQGGGPAHLSVDPLGQFVYVANYGGGSFAVLPILSNGSLVNATDMQQDLDSVGPMHATNAPPGSFAISGHDNPHAHMIQSDAAGKFIFGADLGQDRIYSWTINRTTGKLSATNPAFINVPPGDGPRHFAFHPSGKFFYSLQEEASTMLVYDYNAMTGALTQQQQLSTLPAGFVGTNFTSEVRVSADGKFVYAANRLHDSIAVLRVAGNGRLTLAGEAWTRGDYPRSFTIDPTGRFLIGCNQRSDAVVTFRIDEGEGDDEGGGGLTFTGQYTQVGSPAVVVFLT